MTESGRTTANGWNAGNSVIIAPTGQILAGPVRHEETILYADLDLAAVRAARRMFDPVGHYHRPDIFELAVDIRPRVPVVVRDQDSAGTTVQSSLHRTSLLRAAVDSEGR